jgi:uncharacterized repeat protein (TIGR01451 family)
MTPRTGRSPASLVLSLLTIGGLLFQGLALASSPPTRGSGGSASPRRPEPMDVLPSFQARGATLIRLAAGAFDPLSDSLPAPAGIRLVDEAALRPGAVDYWLVQVRDGRFGEAVRDVEAAGGTIAGFIPEGTYAVRATGAQSQRISASDAVRWVGHYQPAWRVAPAVGGRRGLLELEGPKTYLVHAFSAEPDLASVAEGLAAIRGVHVVERSGSVFVVKATAGQVPAMAALRGVEWIGLKPNVVLLNANARWVTDTGVRDVLAATAPGRLTGKGQTGAVADTAVNYKPDLNGRAHIAFSDCDVGACKEAIYTQATPGNSATSLLTIRDNDTGHRKMVAFFDIGNTGPNPYDPSSHGSHTAGSVDGDQPPYDEYTGEDGLAAAAEHVHQNIGTSGGGLSLPADLYNLFRQAYRPRNPSSVSTTSGSTGNPGDYSTNYVPLEDARTHNNSWGLVAPIVDPAFATRVDQFVWDHEDMVLVFSAGNGGPGAGTILSPSVGKNDLSSGASANGRQPMVSIDSMASFSSHGPTADGRFGVDLATPGQIVVSVKGGSTTDYHTAQGTSMSGPVLTGLATLVRQYFFDGYGPAAGKGFAGGGANAARRHNPSAALVKATLINGAVRMEGRYTGDDGGVPTLNGQWPSAGQGFGLVNLNNSLYFADDPTNNWYRDVYRADAEAFTVTEVAGTRSYPIKVAQGQPLDVTLAYTDAPDLLAAGTPALVNNLDLEVIAPDGTLYVGNNFNSRTNPAVDQAQTVAGPAPADTKNPVERVRIASPGSGTYTVRVRGSAVAMGNQGFALTASGLISQPSGSFNAGPPLQRNEGGNPGISDLVVDPVSSDTATIRFTTSEPTTARATTTVDGSSITFIDSYNLGNTPLPGAPPTDPAYYGLNEGTVETSARYDHRPVVGTEHEILLTGLDPGAEYSIAVQVTDLSNRQASQIATYTSPAGTFQADAPDIAQLSEGPVPVDVAPTGWKTGTQLYVGEFGGADLLGAFMFRIPSGAVDPDEITGAAVEMVSAHNWVPFVTDDPVLTVDLLDESVEPGWGTQGYEGIHSAPADARVYPESTHKVGAYQRYAFTFGCSDLEALKSTLTNGQAAFRWEEGTDAVSDAIFATDFGFNRRSRGADLRPRLVLFTGNDDPYEQACDPGTPAPTITDVGIHDGIAPNSVTVSWRTDVRSDSFVLFREQGTESWIQVGTLARSKLVHHVQVLNLDPNKQYEFAVRSAACNGAATTDTNGGEGYDFFRHAQDPGARTPHASYSFESGSEGWTVQTANPLGSSWERRSPGANPDGTINSSEFGWHVSPYVDESSTTLTSPPVTFTGEQAAVEFFLARDTEPTFDFLHVEHSQDGTNWTTAASIDGFNAEFPDFESRDVRFNHPNPGGSLQIRFRFESDELISSPLYLGVSVDEVTLASYENAPTAEEEQLPLTGPVPPPSAGATGLNPPPTRGGEATAADISHGTGACFVPVEDADLSVTKSDSPDPVLAGENVTYTITVTNGGPGTATGVTLTDQLDPTTQYVSSSSSQGSCSHAGGTVTCNLGSLAGGDTATVTIVVATTQAGTITDTASVSANEPDPDTSNNTDTESTTVNPAADLSVSKTDNPDPVHVGQPLVYTITVTNHGPSAATGVVVTDALPRNAGFGSASTTKGSCTVQRRTVVCTIGDMAAGETVTILIEVKPTRKGTITNTVEVSAQSPADPDSTNNRDSEDTTVFP